MSVTISTGIQTHNERPAAVWSAGGEGYDAISRGIADAIEHCVVRLDPKPGERILDLATGTGWTSRVVARRGADVVGVDIAQGFLEVAHARAAAERLLIAYRPGDAESLPFEDGAFDAVVSTFYYREPSADAAWETFSNGYGPTRALAASLDDGQREALRADFTAFHANFPTDLGICVPREYWLTVGTRTQEGASTC